MPFVLKPTITATFLERVRLTPDQVAFLRKQDDAWKKVTFRQFRNECRTVSFGLRGLGVKPGDRVAILSNTRYEWSLADMAILGAGGITVPIYGSNTSDEVGYILNHSEARVLVLEDLKQLEKIAHRRAAEPGGLPYLENIVVIDPTGVAAGQPSHVLTLEALKDLGARHEASQPGEFERQLVEAKPDDLITICYTSGTTGVPKGAMITHDNMMCVLEDCLSVLERYIRPDKEVVVSFLPFSHIIGKVESMAIYTFGWQAAFAENLDKLIANMGEIHPTLVFAVPRIFEKAHHRINVMMESQPASKRKLFEWAQAAGRRYYDALWEKRRPTLKEAAEYELAKALVFRKISDRFGGKMRFAVCGGAPLPQDIGEFFQIAGIKVLEGYGLTETCAPVTLNTPAAVKFGSVGRPLPESIIKIAEDGEILVKSRKVFKGYYKEPQETAEVMQGGWLHTGDVGYIDDDGFVKITDRKKDIIITSGGKNIAPQKIEGLAKTYPLISQFVVHGDRRNYLTALVTLDREQVIHFANAQQILFSEYAELIKQPKVIGLVQKIVDEMNKSLASFETVKKFTILPNDFTVESGDLTPSMKVRRRLISTRYRDALDAMYTES